MRNAIAFVVFWLILFGVPALGFFAMKDLGSFDGAKRTHHHREYMPASWERLGNRGPAPTPSPFADVDARSIAVAIVKMLLTFLLLILGYGLGFLVAKNISSDGWFERWLEAALCSRPYAKNQ